MEIYPAMGIGDLLVWKMYSVDTGIPITKINLNEKDIDFSHGLMDEEFKNVEISLRSC